MPDLPRDRPHLYLRKNGRSEPYTRKTPPPRSPLPQRDRATRAQAIRSTLDAALTMAEAWHREREPDLAQGTPGFYLDFEIHPGSEMAADLLENRRKNIELVAVRQESETANIVAAADHFLKKVEAYRAENTKPFACIVLFSEHTRPSLRKEILIDRASWFALFGFLVGTHIPE